MKDLHKFPKQQAGIYKISIGPHIYIGQSVDLNVRVQQHLYLLKLNSHYNYNFQQAYNLYGNSQLQITALFKLNISFSNNLKKHLLNVLEQTYINILHADLNIRPVIYSRSYFKYKIYIPTSYKQRLIKARRKHPFLGTLLNEFTPDNMEKVSKVMRTIGPDLLKLFQEAIPNVVANPKLRSLFFAILTRTLTRALPQGYVVTSEEWIAYYVDEWQAYCSNNSKRFTAIKFLQALKDALPEGWEMQWTTPDYEENKARTTRIIVPSYIKEAMYIDARDRPSPRYYMYKWNTKVTSRNASKASDLIHEMEIEAITHAKHPYQEAMLSYLSSRDIREFKPMDIEGAQQLIETYPIGKREYHLQSLAFILDYPKPSYYPVEGCYRIYAPGLQFLKSDIRKALYPKLIDLDLKSCHTAILSTILDLPRTKELLLNKQDFWVYLTFNIDPLLPTFIYPSIKKAIKKTLYALCFGAGVSTLKSIFIEEMEINTELKPSHILKSWKSFKEIDVIQELSSKTQQWRTQLKQDKEYSDVLGNHYTINSSRDIRRACFNMCSAYELALIYPIYQEAIDESKKNRPQFKVLLHSHDGVSIHIPQNHMKIPIITHLSNAVQQVADVLGVPTYLESKTIDVNTQLVEDVGTLQRALIRRT